MDIIEIDGSFEEGGGQILRTSLSLSLLTRKPFRIINIRKNRPNPGLSNQHVACIKACADISNAFVEGNFTGSETVEFVPKILRNRQMEINIGTAGSITLLLQSILLPLMFVESDIKIIGGTDVKWSIPIDYFINIIVPLLNEYSNIDIYCEKRGYYPIGGGIVKVSTKPKYRISDFDDFNKFHQYIFGNPIIELFNPGKLIYIKGISSASKDLQNLEVAEKLSRAVEIGLKGKYPIKIHSEYSNTNSTGSSLMLYALFKSINSKGKEIQYRLGTDMLVEKNNLEEISRKTVNHLLEMINQEIVVDDCLQDNIIPLLGLFGGKIKTGKITKHTRSNIYVCEKFLDVEYIIEKCIKCEKELNQDYNVANFISVLSSRRS